MYIYICPKCNITLKQSSGPFGVFWLCPNCSGKAVSLSVLRQSAPASIVKEFWLSVRSKEFPQKKKCPACSSSMTEVPIMQGEKTVFIDICKKCNFIWFDAKEYESLPQVEIPKEKAENLSIEAREALAKYKIECMAAEREREDKAEAMDIYNIIIRLLLLIIFKRI